jgi:hypothetical protein
MEKEPLVNSLNLVLIEWDGGRPPTKWYNRLARLNLTVRGDMDKSPIARRASESGVIMQEGAIVVHSESEARTLAHMAYSMGAKNVVVGELFPTMLQATSEDLAALKRLENVLGKRGRGEPERDWTITCLDCLKSEQIHGITPVNCPECGSMRIHYYLGKLTTFKSSGDQMFDWVQTRFVSNQFGIAPIADSGEEIPTVVNPVNDMEDLHRIATVKNSKAATTAAEWLTAGKINQDTFYQILDGTYTVTLRDEKELKSRRFYALSKYFELGGSPDNVSLATDVKCPDIFDVMGCSNTILNSAMPVVIEVNK